MTSHLSIAKSDTATYLKQVEFAESAVRTARHDFEQAVGRRDPVPAQRAYLKVLEDATYDLWVAVEQLSLYIEA
jgi:hypothetical protein